MTFAQVLHRVPDHYFGDEAFERRDRKQMEKQNRKILKDFWETIPTDLQERMPQEVRDKALGRKEERAGT